MISIVYLVQLKNEDDSTPVAQDDAASAGWYDLRNMIKKSELFAFDHHDILVELIQTKDEYKTLRE